MNLSLKQLNVFVSVAQHKTITQAALALHLSKAAVSMALSELEKQINKPLFDRHLNRLMLNTEGKRLLPLANDVLAKAEHFTHMLNQDDQLYGQLRLGASDTIGNHITPYLLHDFRVKTHHHNQQALISNTEHICQQLIEFKLDVALVEGEVTHHELVCVPWCVDEMCVIAPVQQNTFYNKVATIMALDDQTWLLREKGSGSRAFFIEHVSTQFQKWQIALELNSTEAIINSVSAGIGLACVSRIAAQHAIDAKRVNLVNIDLPVNRKFSLVYHQDKYHNPLLSQFIQFCNDWVVENLPDQ